MCKKNYVALHNHSHFSILDGFGTIDEYIAAAKEKGMIGIGLTDHGTASGLYEFIMKANKADIIPIAGLEFYVAPENPDGAKVVGPIFYGPGGRKAGYGDVPGNGAYTHMTVFAKNNVGLQNIFKLTSLSWQPEHYYFKPRIDTNMLAEHSEGLIVTTGCPSSEVNRRFMLGQDDKAYEYASRLKSIFGEDLYVEIMDHDMADELERNLTPKLIKLARDLDIKLIGTNDSHYAFQSNADAHEHILAIQTNKTMDVPSFNDGGTRFAFSGPEYYVKPYEEMLKCYDEEIAAEVLENTIEVAEKCKGITMSYDPHLRPEIEIPGGLTPPKYLQKLIMEGMRTLRANDTEEVKRESIKRVKKEFEVIHSNDFVSYFLVVHDYISWAVNNGVNIGTGRGSVGGSEIAFLLGISKTDPIRFDLLFERFLSPGRGSLYQLTLVDDSTLDDVQVSLKWNVHENDTVVDKYTHELLPGDVVENDGNNVVIKDVVITRPGSAPDVDTDFDTVGRERVITYCSQKYGHENVAQIITKSIYKTKSAFKAVCRSYGVPAALQNKVTSTIPDVFEGREITFEEMLDPASPRYAEGEDFRQVTSGPEWDKIIKHAKSISGRISHTGVHPCGVIIANQPLSNIVPVQVRQNDGVLVTQWTYPELESLGLIKMDFLGLETVDIIYNTVDNIKESRGIDIDIDGIIAGEMDDPAVYETLQRGDTVGVFQLASDLVRDVLVRAKPTKFMDIATITALCRPGPMSTGSHTEWADRLNGIKEVKPIHPELAGTTVEEILSETEGLVVFQESLMKIATDFANMTPYESETLRKAMGKKKIDVMMSLQPKFIEGSVDIGGVSEEAAYALWDTLEGFAQYGFNKSHSVSYAINAYLVIWLKVNYPAEFMSSLLQSSISDPVKVATHLQEATSMKLNVGPVDINSSRVKIAASPNSEKYDIVYGFSGVKQVNDELSKIIVNEREANGAYSSVSDFISRVISKHKFNSGALSSLAHSGAFDGLGASRKLVAQNASDLIKMSSRESNRTVGLSLFAMAGVSDSITESIDLTSSEYDYNEKIKLEADVIGLFISGHPTSKLGHIKKMYNSQQLNRVMSNDSRGMVTILGTLTQVASKINRRGQRSIAVYVDDGSASVAAYLDRDFVKQIDKFDELARMQAAAEKGIEYKPSKRSETLIDIVNDPSIIPVNIEKSVPYRIALDKKIFSNGTKYNVASVAELITDSSGRLPYVIKCNSKEAIEAAHGVAKNHKGGQTSIRYIEPDGNYSFLDIKIKLTIDFIMDMEKAIGSENVVTEGI